jgi:5'-3' exonuclease
MDTSEDEQYAVPNGEGDEEAQREGQEEWREMQDEKAFGSNCITPSEYVSPPSLRSSFEPTLSRDGSAIRTDAVFFNKKVTKDSNWWDVELCFGGRASTRS